MKRFLCIVLVCLLTVSFLFSQNTGSVEKNPKIPESVELQNLQLAKQLADYGYKNESVSALLEAVDILIKVCPEKVDIKTEKQGTSNDTKPAFSIKFSPEEILADAKDLAGNDKVYKEWIKKLEKNLSGSRGAKIRLQCFESFAYGNDGCETCHITFKANEPAEIVIFSLDAADLDLYVYDEYGKPVIEDEEADNDCKVVFYPTKTSLYTIQVKNRALHNARFQLTTN